MKRRLLLVLVVGCLAGIAVLLALGSGATASPSKTRASQDKFIFFHLPMKKIYCGYIQTSSPRTKYLRCDNLNGLKPRPSDAGCREGTRQYTMEMYPTGKARYVCVSDSVAEPSGWVLNYGRRWSYGGFTCSASSAGLKCKNLSGRGFFMSRDHSYFL